MADWFGVDAGVAPDHRGEGTEQKEKVMSERMRMSFPLSGDWTQPE